jgi:hypothetical protein
MVEEASGVLGPRANVTVRAWVEMGEAVYDGWASMWSRWSLGPMCLREGGCFCKGGPHGSAGACARGESM